MVHFTQYTSGQAVTATNLNNRLTELSDYIDDMIDGTVPFTNLNLSANLLALGASTILTISGGVVTVTKSYHVIAAQSGTADDLDTITAAADRTFLVLKADTGDTITIKHGTGNIATWNARDITLTGTDHIMLFWDGTQWVNVSPVVSSLIDLADKALADLDDVSAAAQTANFVMAAGDGATGGDYRGRLLVRADLPTAAFPKSAEMQHDQAVAIAGNALTSMVQTLQRYNTLTYQSTASANGDAFENGFMLRAGTYTFYVLGNTNTNCGKLDWYLKTDGGAYGAAFTTGQDWYSNPAVYNVIKSVASVTIASDGYYTIKGVINGKHASSSAYFHSLTKYWFAPASY